MKLVLECQPVVLALVGVVVAWCFDVLVNAVHLLIDLMILVKEASKVCITYFKVVDRVSVFREFVDEVVFLYCHNFD